jgi:hypothetical protein
MTNNATKTRTVWEKYKRWTESLSPLQNALSLWLVVVPSSILLYITLFGGNLWEIALQMVLLGTMSALAVYFGHIYRNQHIE